MSGPSIVIDSLVLSLGRERILQEVSLEVAPGTTLGLIGPNGAGKTTLVGCLVGLLRPDSGSVRVDGLDPRERRARVGLGAVPERPSFDAGRSARANLALHHGLAGLPEAGRAEAIEGALERVGLQDASRRAVRRFSKGMLQRLAFAAALLGRPRWLVLDEPFSGVDPAGVALLRGLVLAARASGTTVVLNSHRLDQVGRLCDRVALIERGRIGRVADCSPGGLGNDAALEALVVGASETSP